MTYDEAAKIVTDAGISLKEVGFPVGGEQKGALAAQNGNYRLAAACYCIGCMACGGHNRAAWMKENSEWYEDRAREQQAAKDRG